MLPTARFRMLLLVASPALAYPSSTKSLMVRGAETLMRPKRHGTCSKAPAQTLRWGVDYATTDNICCFNRHYAEGSGSYSSNNLFMAEAKRGGEITYYDSVTRKPLFIAPRGRSLEAFLDESSHHGWPSFRDEEVVWDNVRVLSDGECVSVDGTHLGHNIPDVHGHRYCINICSVAGLPPPRRMTQEEVRLALRRGGGGGGRKDVTAARPSSPPDSYQI